MEEEDTKTTENAGSSTLTARRPHVELRSLFFLLSPLPSVSVVEHYIRWNKPPFVALDPPPTPQFIVSSQVGLPHLVENAGNSTPL